MNPRQLLSDDNAVSPVIGVILMVAITVILAAVIASFVLGMGPDTATTPTATFDSEVDSSDQLVITMGSGEAIDENNVVVRGSVDGTDFDEFSWNGTSNGNNEIVAGSSVTLGADYSGDYTVRLVYESGDTSSTLRTFEN